MYLSLAVLVHQHQELSYNANCIYLWQSWFINTRKFRTTQIVFISGSLGSSTPGNFVQHKLYLSLAVLVHQHQELSYNANCIYLWQSWFINTRNFRTTQIVFISGSLGSSTSGNFVQRQLYLSLAVLVHHHQEISYNANCMYLWQSWFINTRKFRTTPIVFISGSLGSSTSGNFVQRQLYVSLAVLVHQHQEISYNANCNYLWQSWFINTRNFRTTPIVFISGSLGSSTSGTSYNANCIYLWQSWFINIRNFRTTQIVFISGSLGSSTPGNFVQRQLYLSLAVLVHQHQELSYNANCIYLWQSWFINIRKFRTTPIVFISGSLGSSTSGNFVQRQLYVSLAVLVHQHKEISYNANCIYLWQSWFINIRKFRTTPIVCISGSLGSSTPGNFVQRKLYLSLAVLVHQHQELSYNANCIYLWQSWFINTRKFRTTPIVFISGSLGSSTSGNFVQRQLYVSLAVLVHQHQEISYNANCIYLWQSWFINTRNFRTTPIVFISGSLGSSTSGTFVQRKLYLSLAVLVHQHQEISYNANCIHLWQSWFFNIRNFRTTPIVFISGSLGSSTPGNFVQHKLYLSLAVLVHQHQELSYNANCIYLWQSWFINTRKFCTTPIVLSLAVLVHQHQEISCNTNCIYLWQSWFINIRNFRTTQIVFISGSLGSSTPGNFVQRQLYLSLAVLVHQHQEISYNANCIYLWQSWFINTRKFRTTPIVFISGSLGSSTSRNFVQRKFYVSLTVLVLQHQEISYNANCLYLWQSWFINTRKFRTTPIVFISGSLGSSTSGNFVQHKLYLSLAVLVHQHQELSYNANCIYLWQSWFINTRKFRTTPIVFISGSLGSSTSGNFVQRKLYLSLAVLVHQHQIISYNANCMYLWQSWFFNIRKFRTTQIVFISGSLGSSTSGNFGQYKRYPSLAVTIYFLVQYRQKI